MANVVKIKLNQGWFKPSICSCHLTPLTQFFWPLHHWPHVRMAIRGPHVAQIMYGHANRHVVTFWPNMFGLHQAEAPKFPKICSDHQEALPPIIGGPSGGRRLFGSHHKILKSRRSCQLGLIWFSERPYRRYWCNGQKTALWNTECS